MLGQRCRLWANINSYNAERFVYKLWMTKGFLNLRFIRNVFVSSFRFIWIHILWAHGHYKYFTFFSEEIDSRRQNITSIDVRFWRLKSVPALEGSNEIWFNDSCLWLCWFNVGPALQTVANLKPSQAERLMFASTSTYKYQSKNHFQTNLFWQKDTINMIQQQDLNAR